MRELTANLDTIDEIASTIIAMFGEHTILYLNGDLASGKTTLTQALVKNISGDVQEVTSPTFSISQNYPNGIYHYDLYNKDIQEFIILGLFEQLELPKLHIIEWAPDKLKELVKEYGFKAINIDIQNSGSSRIYRITNA